MKRTASRPRKGSISHGEAGFTLTELLVGLLVASMLIVGLAEVTRRYAQTTTRIRHAATDIRAADLVAGLMRQLERADTGTIEVTPTRVTARLGSADLRAELIVDSNGARKLDWSSPTLRRSIPMSEGVRFAETGFGAIVLLESLEGPPLAIVVPTRTVPFDCQFDATTRACR